MASGKQLSFQHGEVSPSLRFRSDAVSYSSGLGKLKNMYVRRAGGVSNRPGFEFVNIADSQDFIPEPGGLAGIKGFTYWAPAAEKWYTIQYGYFKIGAYTGAPSAWSFIVSDAFMVQVPNNVTGPAMPNPDQVRFTIIKDKVFISPEMSEYTISGANKRFNVAITNGFPNATGFGLNSTIGDRYYTNYITAVSQTGTIQGTTPYMPASYLITLQLDDGTEVEYLDFYSVGWTSTSAVPTNGVVYPHASLSMKFDITFNHSGGVLQGKKVKSFNFYRASGANGYAGSFYKLAGRVLFDGSVASPATITFNDFGVDDPSNTPAIDKSALTKVGTYAGAVSGATAAAYYQQRLILSIKPGTTPSVKPGDLLASKLGAPEQLRTPVIYNNTGAFQFSVPITDGTPVVALLAMERLIAFTQRGVYAVRGGQQGELTPTQVNPFVISEEGCSVTVEPKMAGKRGYFINNSHTKLMSIEFSVDGNLTVGEASIFSDHMLAEDITQMEVLAGGEDTVYLLRKDGKLVRITPTEDGAHGFSLIETSGYIESIYRGKAKKPYSRNVVDATADRYYDVLMAYVIRNGVRTIERLNVRNDKYREAEFFADCYGAFGWRLALNGAAGYKKVPASDSVAAWAGQTNFNIGDASTTVWTAGATIALHAKDGGLVDGAYHFYYEDADGVTQFIRGMVSGTNATPAISGYTQAWNVVFNLDVPASLRNAEGQTGLTSTQRNKITTRWLEAYNQLPAYYGDECLFGPWVATSKNVTAATAVSENLPVTVVADGEILSSPLNPNKSTLELVATALSPTSIDLTLPLPDYYAWGYVGVPYTAEFETLDLESQDNRTLTDSQKIINAVGVGLLETRGGFYGMPDQDLTNMEEKAYREEESFAVQTPNFNGYISVPVPAEYNRTGRVNIKQVDPAPITILAVYPKGISGD